MGAKIFPEVKQQAMPNAKILSEKKAVVEALAERFKGASAGVFVDYRGITVAEDTQLRRELVSNGDFHRGFAFFFDDADGNASPVVRPDLLRGFHLNDEFRCE